MDHNYAKLPPPSAEEIFAQQFNETFEKLSGNPQFKEWLIRNPKNDLEAICICCKNPLKLFPSTLKFHSKSVHHITNF